jgi:hypothetical protein
MLYIVYFDKILIRHEKVKMSSDGKICLMKILLQALFLNTRPLPAAALNLCSIEKIRKS